MPQVMIIADDLTGAADTGAPFAQAGLITLIRISLRPLRRLRYAADVLVSLTHSRHVSEKETICRNRRVAEYMQTIAPPYRPPWIYQKIDSTLRGYPAAAFMTTMNTLGLKRALLAPAFPAQGRTTIKGEVLVDGERLVDSEFAAEVSEGRLPTLLRPYQSDKACRLLPLTLIRRGQQYLAEALNTPGPTIFIADAETEADLMQLAQAAITNKIRLLCGSAGLAHALAEVLPIRSHAEPPALPSGHDGAILVVAGSLHPQTARQITVAQQDGLAVIRPDNVEFRCSTGWLEKTRQIIKKHLACRRDVILTTVGLKPVPGGAEKIAADLGQIVCCLSEDVPIGGLVLTGGDIALAVCEALGVTKLYLQDEVEPGIAKGRIVDGKRPGLPVVTKAGGFGSEQVLLAAIAQLKTMQLGGL